MRACGPERRSVGAVCSITALAVRPADDSKETTDAIRRIAIVIEIEPDRCRCAAAGPSAGCARLVSRSAVPRRRCGLRDRRVDRRRSRPVKRAWHAAIACCQRVPVSSSACALERHFQPPTIRGHRSLRSGYCGCYRGRSPVNRIPRLIGGVTRPIGAMSVVSLSSVFEVMPSQVAASISLYPSV